MQGYRGGLIFIDNECIDILEVCIIEFLQLSDYIVFLAQAMFNKKLSVNDSESFCYHNHGTNNAYSHLVI